MRQIFVQLNAYPNQNLVKRVGLGTEKLTLAKAPRTPRLGYGFNCGGAMMKDGITITVNVMPEEDLGDLFGFARVNTKEPSSPLKR